MSDHKSASFSAWLICLSASFYFFYAFMQLNQLNSISHQLMQIWHINAKQLSYLSMVSLISSAILFIPIGFALDKLSIRKIMLVSLFISIMATFIFSLAQTYQQAIIARFFIGTGYTVALLGCIRLITYWLSKQLAFGLGMVTTIGLLGGIFAQTPIVELSNYYGWRIALLFTAIIGLFVLCIVWLYVKDFPAKQITIAERVPYQPTAIIKMILFNKYYWLCAAYACLLNAPVLFMGDLWGNMYLVQRFHLLPSQASYIISMMFVGMIVGCPIIGWISDFYNNRSKLMLINACVLLLTFPLVFFVKNLSLFQLMTLYFLSGVLISTQALIYPFMMKVNITDVIGLATGFASTLIMLGNALLQTIFGLVIYINTHQYYISHVIHHSLFEKINILILMLFAFIICILIAFHLCITTERYSLSHNMTE